MRSPLLAAGALLGAALLIDRERAEAPAADLLDQRQADYLEDAPGARPVATVRAQLRRERDEVRLQLEVGPRGPGVDPVPGLEGVHGANLRTAEELEELLADGQLRLLRREGGRSIRGELLRVERARLPARAIAADGLLALHTETAASLPVRVVFGSDALPSGPSTLYLEARGVPRLCVEVVRDGARAAIRSIDSLGERQQVLPAATGSRP